jgi:hypothetical protein
VVIVGKVARRSVRLEARTAGCARKAYQRRQGGSAKYTQVSISCRRISDELCAEPHLADRSYGSLEAGEIGGELQKLCDNVLNLTRAVREKINKSSGLRATCCRLRKPSKAPPT